MPRIPGFDPVVTALDTTRNILFINRDEEEKLKLERGSLERVTGETPIFA